MRKRIFEIIELSKDNDRASHIYDFSMMTIILISLLPLVFKQEYPILTVIDNAAAVLFLIDYAARLLTADFKLHKKATSFLLYPFTPMALIDLLAILPTFTMLASGFRILKLFRLFRAVRVLRVFKFFRYSKSFAIIAKVMRKQREALLAVCALAAAYLLICALIIFNVEPDTFENFFEAVYWATISLTTMGYGDIYPVSAIGRCVTMLSSFVGIAIVALPSGIITAGYMEEIRAEKESEENGEEKESESDQTRKR